MLSLWGLEEVNISENSSSLLLCMFPRINIVNVRDKELELDSQ